LAGCATRIGEIINSYTILIGIMMIPLGRPRLRWKVTPLPTVLEANGHDHTVLLTSLPVIIFVGLVERQSLYKCCTSIAEMKMKIYHNHSE
jgi:hypothetical protein